MSERTPPIKDDRLPRLGFSAGMLLLLAAAGALRVVWLGDLPPGLPGAAAEHGLLARALVESGIPGALRDADAASVPLAALIAMAGRLTGFDVATPALGAALAGTATVGFTALWLRRAVGPVGGLAGGALLAGSFWSLLFGRLGLSPAVGAAGLAALLWLLLEAIRRPLRLALPWYVLAGLAAAVAFAADPVLRVVPALLLVALGAALWRARRSESDRDVAWGLAISLLVATLAALPVVAGGGGAAGRLGFWSPTPGLPGDTVSGITETIHGYGSALSRIVWPGAPDTALNLPDAPLFDLWLVPWVLVGSVVAVRRVRRPLATVGLVWGALLLLPAALVDPDHPGRLLPALPLLTLLPVLGMRVAVERAHGRWRRVVMTGAAVATIAATVITGAWRYFAGWAADPATGWALDAGVVASLAAIRDLPPDGMVVYSTYGRDAVVRYLSGDAPRVDVDGRHLLLLPGDPATGVRRGWLVVPAATPVDPHLMEIFAEIPPVEVAHAPDGAELYRVYRIDERLGQHIPLSVPTIPWGDGIVFQGFRLTPLEGGRVTLVFAWALPAGSAAHTAAVQLAGESISEARLALPATAPDQPMIALAMATLDIPGTSEPLDLRLALLDADGRPNAVPGADADGFLLLERYRFEP